MPNLDLKYITDENGNRVLPITHVNAVRDSSGNTLPSLMAPEKNGSGIGTCSTSSGTALTVSLTGYELVQNGIVAVTFANDVPASATLNINGKGAKPIIYKGSAITADTIKADDTAIFSYDGTNYVLCSSGAGGAAPVNPNETVNISLTQVGGNSADLIGVSVTITNDDTGDIFYGTTWKGSTITTEIPMGTYYTISVETIAGYLACEPKSYLAGYQTERNISFQYRSYGVFIEDTNGYLYTSSGWPSGGVTANSIVVITSSSKFRIALNAAAVKTLHSNYTDNLYAYLPYKDEAAARTDYYGRANTNAIIQFNIAYGTNTTSYAAPYCNNFEFAYPRGLKGYLPACGQVLIMYQNKTNIDTCLSACNGGTPTSSYSYMWSSTAAPQSSYIIYAWSVKWDDGTTNDSYFSAPAGVYPVADYE